VSTRPHSSNELGDVSGRLIGHVLAFGSEEIILERGPDPWVPVPRPSLQRVPAPPVSTDVLRGR